MLFFLLFPTCFGMFLMCNSKSKLLAVFQSGSDIILFAAAATQCAKDTILCDLICIMIEVTDWLYCVQ